MTTEELAAQEKLLADVKASALAEVAKAKADADAGVKLAQEYQAQLKLAGDEKVKALASAQADTDKFKLAMAREKLRNEAARAGIVNVALVDTLPSEGLSVDAAGQVVGVQAVLDGWKKTLPEIFGKAEAAAAAAAASAAVTTPLKIPTAASAAPGAASGGASPAPRDFLKEGIALGPAGRKAQRAQYELDKAKILQESHEIAGQFGGRQ